MMNDDGERDRLLAERAKLEADLGAIRQVKNANELEIIRKDLHPSDDFRLRRENELVARKSGAAARERLAEIVARLREIKPRSTESEQAETLRSILETLVEIRDALKTKSSYAEESEGF